MSAAQQRRVLWEMEHGVKRASSHRSEKTRRRMADAQRGKKASADTRRKLSEAHKSPSEEVREKLRQAVLQRPEGTKRAFALNQIGKPKSTEHKQKIADGQRLAWARRKTVDTGTPQVVVPDEEH